MKRQNPRAEKEEPKAKRAAISDVTRAVSNLGIDSSKKSSLLQPKKIVSGVRRSLGRRILSNVVSQQQNKPKEIVKKAPASFDPCPGFDFDKLNEKDINAVADYAFDIFRYYKFRESRFRVTDYTSRQLECSKKRRACIVDWMVEVQETFELKHETLYLAVKLFDTYMTKTKERVSKEALQKVACSALFIAAKYDEQYPPLIDDIIHICGNAFDREEFCAMERIMFNVVGFDIGMPLSYRFQRRLAKVAQVEMEDLTLARFILETSLMFSEYISVPESQMAAASFLLTLRMKKLGDWTPALHKYSGYKLQDVEPLMWSLNHMMRSKPTVYSEFKFIHEKYSHRIFFEVAAVPFLEGGKALSEPVGPPAALLKKPN
ncbi:hypothetical protein L596_014720 [Steinernema carpocapsae]|uniref:Uncharacterized protein n=1 Tax=Steinernema carpocapsae TaxID=34508 RepID=A0A4U5NCQ2_STECR|nr:hypothetical protein L596_014720 [Steinernema carpocapsae]